MPILKKSFLPYAILAMLFVSMFVIGVQISSADHNGLPQCLGIPGEPECDNQAPPSQSPVGSPPPARDPIGTCIDPTGCLTNPLESDDIIDFLIKIIDVILIFALPIIILYIMYAGFLFVTARGEPAQITKARTALLWAVVGGTIALGAKLIIEVIKGTIAAF